MAVTEATVQNEEAHAGLIQHAKLGYSGLQLRYVVAPEAALDTLLRLPRDAAKTEFSGRIR